MTTRTALRLPVSPVTLLALAALLTTFAGFYRSFFSNPAANDAAHLLHGVFATLWVVLLVVQSSLIRAGQWKLHRQIGWASVVLAAALAVTGFVMIRTMLADPDGLPQPLRLLLGYIDLTTLPLFVALYAGALAYRKKRALHSRLMGATLLVGLIPSAGRVFAIYVPAVHGLEGGLLVTLAVVDLILLGLIASDWREGKLRWPFPATLAWFILVELTLYPGSQSAAFGALVKAITG